MVSKEFCDRCGKEIIKTKDKTPYDNNLYVKVGDREISDKDLCDKCICEAEIVLRDFILNKVGKDEI